MIFVLCDFRNVKCRLQHGTSMQTKTDHELRTIAAELIRNMNKVTGTTTTYQAQMLGLHKANVAACINQGRVENLGWKSISRLLRTYGFEVSDDGIHIRHSESCPVFFPFPFTDEMKDGLKTVVNNLRSFGLKCYFFPLILDDELPDITEVGGILYAIEGKEIWACIALSGHGFPNLAPFFRTELKALPKLNRLKISVKLFESWCDSPPHKTEVVHFFKSKKPY